MHLGLPKDIPVQYHQYIPICTGRVPKTAFVSPASDSGRLLDRLNPEAIHHLVSREVFLAPIQLHSAAVSSCARLFWSLSRPSQNLLQLQASTAIRTPSITCTQAAPETTGTDRLEPQNHQLTTFYPVDQILPLIFLQPRQSHTLEATFSGIVSQTLAIVTPCMSPSFIHFHPPTCLPRLIPSPNSSS